MGNARAEKAKLQIDEQFNEMGEHRTDSGAHRIESRDLHSTTNGHGSSTAKPDEASAHQTESTEPQDANGTDCLIATADTNGVIQSVSYSQRYFYNLPLSELKGQVAFSLACESDKPHINSRWQEMLTNKLPVRVQWKYVHPDNFDIFFESTLFPNLTSDGEIDHIVIMSTDISEQKHHETELRHSEERYRHLVEFSPLAIIVHIDGKIVYANPATLELVGLHKPEDLLGYSIFDLVAPNERTEVIQRSNYAMQQEGNTIPLQEHSICFRGHESIIETTGVGICYDGKPAVQVFVRDITQRKKDELAIARAESLLRGQNKILNLIAKGATLQQTLNEIVQQVESQTAGKQCVLFVNRRDYKFQVGHHPTDKILWSKSLLSPAGETLGTMRIYGSDAEAEPGTMPKQRDIGEVDSSMAVDSGSGEVDRPMSAQSAIGDAAEARPESLSKQALKFYEAYGQLAALAIHQWVSTEEIAYLAYHDPLTNLPNRRVVEDTFRSIQASPNADKQCAIMILDIDRFKWINDTFGHDMGDQVVRVIASRLLNCVDDGDVVSRMGGDEFTIIIRDYRNEAELQQLGKAILRSVRDTVYIGRHEFNISISIGTALYPIHGDTLNALLKNADSAMYEAKAMGRNTMSVYTLEMNQRLQDRLVLEADILKAVEKHEFTVEFQPKVNLRSHRITGAEALIRWYHVDRGVVSPDQFIHVAEDMGLIFSIDKLVLECVLGHLQSLKTEGLPLVPIAVNVSAKQFVRPEFSKLIQGALDRFNVEPELLELEITETALMTNINTAAKNIRELSRLGVKIVLDDFGTGYSSLSFLNNFEIDTLKIDRSFVNGLSWRDATCESILISIISLGQSLGVTVIAEGVEIKEQLQFLKDRGCDEAQGHLFSKPVTMDEFKPLLTAGALALQQADAN